MIKLWKKEDLKSLLEYPEEVVENVDDVINILDENYGFNRKLTDDGGYVCIIEDIKEEEFEVDIKNGDFLEYAKVHDNYYGTSLKPINNALNEGKLVVFDIDVQGHEIVRSKLDSIVTSVFITTPSLEVLETRLNSRNTDSLDIIEKRIKNAKGEVEYFQNYDYLIINDDLEIAAKQLVCIANITRIKSKLFEKDTIVSSWLK